MPTNDERREVSRRLRDNAGQKPGWVIPWAAFNDAYEHEGSELLNRLADLIEPEERTCRNIADETYKEVGEPFICSECGADPHEGENFFCGFSSDEHDWRFCPNCGAKVVGE